MAIRPEDIRNVCMIGHRGSGKTALAEAMLHVATHGSAERGNAAGGAGGGSRSGNVLDYTEEETEREMTLGTSVGHVEWKGRHINILDTPGDGGFVADAFIAQRVTECAILVVHAQDPVQVVTERLWRRGEREGIPHFIVVNHLDRERADFGAVVEQLRERFGPAVVPLNLPIGSGEDLRGVYGLVSGLAFTGGEQSAETPEGMQEEVNNARIQLFETIAESDDTLLERYLEGEELTSEETFEGLRRGIADGVIIPVIATSAVAMVGVDRLLDAIAGSAPSPGDRPVRGGESPESGAEVRYRCAEDEPFSAYVFKTYVDPYAGKLSVMKVISGRCRSDESLVNPRTGSAERLGSAAHLFGKERLPVDEALPGDILAVAKLRETETFDTLCLPDSPVLYPAVELPDSSTAVAVGASSRGEEEKVFESIRRVTSEDPSLVLYRSPETGEDILAGLSQLHVEFALERVTRRYGVEVEWRVPKVPFKETITGPSKSQGRYKKQTGGRGQFGDCWIELAPLERGAGFEFENAITGGVIPRQFIPAVEKGIQEAMLAGPLAGYPVVDAKVRLYDGSHHPVDSSEMAFKVAGSLAFKSAVDGANPVLLEPYVRVSVTVPQELVGEVMGDLSGRRGRPMGIDQIGERQVVEAEVPQVEILTYARDLRAITGGRANFHTEPAHYEEVPPNLVEKVLEANREKEESVN